MIKEDILLGGEESGECLKVIFRERWYLDGFNTFEFMAKSGKTLDILINEVYNIVEKFSFERHDLHVEDNVKNRIINDCINGKYTSFGKYVIKKIENTDGHKFYFDENTWLMIRPSEQNLFLEHIWKVLLRKNVLIFLRVLENLLD